MDSTADVVVLRIAGRLPERSSCLVLEGDQGGYPTGAAVVQVLLTGARQRDPNALPPMAFANSQPIHVPPPPVPGGDQGTDDLGFSLGHQKSSRRIGDQTLDVLYAVGRTCMLTPRLRPQFQDRWRVLRPRPTYRDLLASQVQVWRGRPGPVTLTYRMPRSAGTTDFVE